MNDNEREKFIKIEQVEKARKKFHKFIFTNFPLLYTFSSSGSGWTTFVRCEREKCLKEMFCWLFMAEIAYHNEELCFVEHNLKLNQQKKAHVLCADF